MINLSSILTRNCGLKCYYISEVVKCGQLLRMSQLHNTNVLIQPKDIINSKLNSKIREFGLNKQEEINTPTNSIKIGLPQFINNVLYENPTKNQKIITPPEKSGHSYVESVCVETYLFNRLRNDTKHRKRAFPKRGYFRRTRALNRRLDRLSYAYALEGIDYEMLENLEIGEIPDLRNFIKK